MTARNAAVSEPFRSIVNGISPHVPAKFGSAADRADCARFAKEQRAKFSSLSGNWTAREWRMQVLIATHNRLARLTAARRNFAVIHAECQADARKDVATPRLTAQQLGADQWGQAEADACQERELARQPNGGYCHE